MTADPGRGAEPSDEVPRAAGGRAKGEDDADRGSVDSAPDRRAGEGPVLDRGPVPPAPARLAPPPRPVTEGDTVDSLTEEHLLHVRSAALP